MKTEKCIRPSRYDNVGISCLICRPDESTEIKGTVQFSHGMCEYKERYIPFMEYLCDNGYVCVISDHRGHGESVLADDDLGYFYSGGADALVDDLLAINGMIRDMYPDKPLILFGHSMGSLAVRSFTKKYDDHIDGLIVCGSPSRNPAAGAGRMLAKAIAFLKGDRHRPQVIQKIAFEGFNRNFESEGKNAWLSTNKENVSRYNDDPLCTYQFTCNGFIGLFDLMTDTYSSKGWQIGKPELPVHFIAGSDDPCITSIRDFEDAVDHLRSSGYKNVTARTYSGMRHEILNETEKEIVWKDVLDILDKWTRA